MNEYLIGYGGGRGPAEWHAEKKIEAPSLRAAVEIFEYACGPEVVIYSAELVG